MGSVIDDIRKSIGVLIEKSDAEFREKHGDVAFECMKMKRSIYHQCLLFGDAWIDFDEPTKQKAEKGS